MSALGGGGWLLLLSLPAAVLNVRPAQSPGGDGAAVADADGDGQDDAAADDARRDAQPAPDVHTVQKGDTRWTLCETYFRDPWQWPKLWAMNPDVTNPHWIFPGQTLKLGGARVAGAGGVAAVRPGSSMRAPMPGPGPSSAPPPADNGMLREVGFVDSSELAFAGTINGSREEKIMLSTGDQAYVELSRDRPVRVGERFTVYQVDEQNPIKDPDSSATLGYLVRVYGDVSIDALTDHHVASATLLDLVQPVERGYRVGPLFRHFKRVKPRPNGSTMSARVVGAVQPNLLIAEGMFVVLNRGTRDGVELGNRFTIIRQGDGYQSVVEDWAKIDSRFPQDAVAEILAVDVREETSIGWVTGGNRSVRIGDVAEMRKGK